ncbi:MAG: hypothetical protein RLZ81_1437 [Pseudomonadota bacterium]|jgi:hypothetical protein
MASSSSPLRPYPDAQARLEDACLRQRRGQSAAPASTDEQQARDSVSAAQALALSGGGIRSATFNLGLLQALAQAGRLKDIDYLSTVSGGGYIGAFLGRLYHRAAEEAPGASATATARDVQQVLASDGAPMLRWLRDHGRYLAPQGLKDRLFAYGIYLRNLLTIHVLLGITLLAAFLLWAALRILLPALMRASADGFAFAYLPDGTGLSPAWGAALLLGAVALALCWTYWMHRASALLAWQQRLLALGLAALAAFTFYQRLPGYLADITERLPGALLLAAAVIGAGACAASFVAGWGLAGDLGAIRNRISRWTRMILFALAACAAFALLDDVAYRAFIWFGRDDAPANALIGAGLTGALLAGLRALAQAAAARSEARPRPASGNWTSLLIAAAGVILLVLVALGWAYAVEAFVWSGVPRGTVPHDAWPTLGSAVALLLLVWLAGRQLDVLNLSSLHAFYAARLARAYLGAGNAARGVPWSAQPARSGGRLVPVSQVAAGDDLAWADYAPHRHGGPLHLVNVNVNQSRYSAGGDFQPDRKGWNLGLGPAGFNLGRSRWQPPSWPGAEALNLGQWASVSGAAFTTGAGARTELGFSALLGLLGVRLGYWWRAGDSQAKPPHMLTALWHEITGAFNPDVSSHWYLSDGGHFENTGAYELIRRRVKRIVLADCGSDPHYEFEDLANLALKVRIDFGAELQFFGPDDLDRHLASEPDVRALFTDPRAMVSRDGPALLLATVRHPDDAQPGWLVVVKPRLPGQLSADLARYAERNPAFPQQPTADQFYDEAQWESHHRLGRLLGDQLAQALDRLPAWRDGSAPWPATLQGARWFGRDATAEPAPASEAASSPASVLKLYAPLVIALWTGFEFYSKWQQDQAKEAAETSKLVLARIDVLERQVFGHDGCAASEDPLKSCPTVPAQTLFVKHLLANLAPNNAAPLSEVVAKIEEAVNVKKPQLSQQATVAAAQAAPPLELALVQGQRPTPVGAEIRERALVYIQIYDETRRADAKRMIERLQGVGLKPNQLPGVENVVKTTQSAGAKPPARFERPTAVYYHAEDKALAEWLVRQAVADDTLAVDLRDLSKRFPAVRQGLVELWLP